MPLLPSRVCGLPGVEAREEEGLEGMVRRDVMLPWTKGEIVHGDLIAEGEGAVVAETSLSHGKESAIVNENMTAFGRCA
jgi:hypothetical protein